MREQDEAKDASIAERAEDVPNEGGWSRLGDLLRLRQGFCFSLENEIGDNDEN